MPRLRRPPRIAFGDPMIASSLLVSHTISLGNVAGSLGAGVDTSLPASAALEALPRNKAAAPNRSATERLVSFMAQTFSFVFGILLGIERLANRLADKNHQNERDCKRSERRKGQPQLVPVLGLQ